MAARGPVRLAVAAIGAVSPIGASAAESSAAIRAGLCRFRELPWYRPLTAAPPWDVPEPVAASAIASLPARAPGPERLLELARSALRDLIDHGGLRRADLARTVLFLALPEIDAATRGWGLGAAFGARLCEQAGLRALPVAAARTEGAAGSVAILADVQAHLQGAPADLALVLGVDTHIDDDRLRVLDGDARLKSARTTDGVIPGEAAVALLVEAAGASSGRAARAVLGPVGVGQEPQLRTSDKESSGRGLTEALRQALAGAPAASRWCLCDLDGGQYRAAEWAVVAARLGAQLQSVCRLSHPADCLGDVGAATGGLLVAQAAAGFDRGYARADEALAWTSSCQHGLRAAVRVLPPGA